jgi:hypothetical protein
MTNMGIVETVTGILLLIVLILGIVWLVRHL